MKYQEIEGECTLCGLRKLFENKERQICSTCLRKERKNETNALKERKIYVFPQYSAKGKKKHDEIIAMKKKVGQKAKASNRYFCQGCFDVSKGVTNSHIISIAQRPDLAADKDNINLLCIECHQNWESGNIEKMILPTFLNDMKYIYKHDTERFFKILFKMTGYDGPFGKVQRMLSKIEKIVEFAE